MHVQEKQNRKKTLAGGWRQSFANALSDLRRGVEPPGDRATLDVRDPHRFLGWCFYLLRIGTVLALLLVTLTQPVRGRLDYIIELNILLFVAYNILLEVVRSRIPLLRSFAWVCVLDLPVVLLVYSLDAAPGGLLFVLVFLDVVCAAISMTLRASLLFTSIVIMCIAVIDPTFPLWSDDAGDVRRLLSRLLLLALTALGTAILTQRLRLEQMIAQRSRDEVVRHTELNRLRSEFVAMISHDLRTPLTGIRAGIGMLEASAFDRLLPDERELISSTRRNTQRLNRLINDLLALNQLEAGALQLNCTPLDLRRAVTDLLPTVHPMIADKGQTLEVELPESLPVLGDVQRLEQVVLNLVVNAHAHTPPGTRITITGATAPTEVHLSVQDTGPGIPFEEQAKIWERFYSRSTRRGSSGLGLAIAKALIELHGGRVWVESMVGSGATFWIALPRHVEGAAE